MTQELLLKRKRRLPRKVLPSKLGNRQLKLSGLKSTKRNVFSQKPLLSQRSK